METFFGPDPAGLTIAQMVARSVLVFLLALLYMRLAGVRTFSKKSPFDQLLIFISAILFARAITASDPLLPLLGAITALFVMSKLVSLIVHQSEGMEHALKGRPLEIIREGNYVTDNIKRARLTPNEILEYLRLHAQSDDVSTVRSAYIEPSGKISIVRKAPVSVEQKDNSWKTPPLKREMETAVSAMNQLQANGFEHNFSVNEKGLHEGSESRYYGPHEVTIVNFFRFEGESDPADNSIVYAIKTADGKKGVLTDAYGPYADKEVSSFITEVEKISASSKKPQNKM